MRKGLLFSVVSIMTLAPLSSCKKQVVTPPVPEYGPVSPQTQPISPHQAANEGEIDIVRADDQWNVEATKGIRHWYTKITTIASVEATYDLPNGKLISYFKGDVQFVNKETGLSRVIFVPKTPYDWIRTFRQKSSAVYMKSDDTDPWSAKSSIPDDIITIADFSEVFPHELTKDEETKCLDCATLTVKSTDMVRITSHDVNGYVLKEGPPLQKARVLIGGYKPGDGMRIMDHVFEGRGAFADIICLQNCFDLHKEDVYRMHIDTLRISPPCYLGQRCSDTYQNLPYFWLSSKSGKNAWQILELCLNDAAGNCVAVSTLNARQ